MYVHVTDIYACKSNPCLNNGHCYDIVKGFLCTCNGYFGGRTCSGWY